MRRNDPRLVTYVLVFLIVYMLLTGTLILTLRGLILRDRTQQAKQLESKRASLEAQVSERTRQEDEIVRELISTSGAQNFEQAYSIIRSQIDNLSAQVTAVDNRGGEERQARLAAEAKRDSIYSQVQALELETQRLQANVQACTDRKAACEASLQSC